MRVLVDTNILIRSVQHVHPSMRVARDSLRSLYGRGHQLCVAPQNVSEFWNVCTRPASVNRSSDLTHGVVFRILLDSISTYRKWRDLVSSHEVRGARVHDARLVATMMTSQVAAVLTFNATDFARYQKIVVLNPAKV